MRGPGLDSPCFPMSNTGINGSRSAAAAAGYAAKMHQDSSLPPPSAPTQVVHPSYMQTNSLTQLQQQSEMWHNYQEDLRPRSSGNPYMIQDIQSPYHHHQPSPPLSIPSPMTMDHHRQTPGHPIHHINPISMPMTPPLSIMSMTPPHSNENIPPDEPLHLKEKIVPEDGDLKQPAEAMQPLMENNQSEYGSNVYGSHMTQINSQQFEKVDDVKVKRQSNTAAGSTRTTSFSSSSKKPSPKPLPDFNEAFGSTERGRFQSPPDPRLGPNKGYLDLFCEDGPPLKFDDFHI